MTIREITYNSHEGDTMPSYDNNTLTTSEVPPVNNWKMQPKWQNPPDLPVRQPIIAALQHAQRLGYERTVLSLKVALHFLDHECEE